MNATPADLVRIVVNADDLGRSESINDAIFFGITEGVITSSTLMATGAALDDAVRRLREFPTASFGVHLNVTEHRPLTPDPRLAPLLDRSGDFDRMAVYDVRWTRSLMDAVAHEWLAQVRRIQHLGVSVSHLDSHHHSHTVPGLFIPLKRVQRACGIRRVRGTLSIYDRRTTPSLALQAKKRVWMLAARHLFDTRMTSEFADFLTFLRALEEGSYRPHRRPTTIELMVHPDGSSANADESVALRRGWLDRLPWQAQLISYTEI